jgi:hypothetical protein
MVFTGSGRRYVRPQSAIGGAGKGGMGSIYAGATQFVRHSVDAALNVSATTLASGKAIALPLVLYQNSSGNASADPTVSSTPSVALGSRVNHIQVQLQIAQADPTKPNNCYVGFISTSFSDGALNAAGMTRNFNDLISMADATTGTMTGGAIQDYTIKDYMESPEQRHWIRGLAKNQYTLYSGRPAILDSILPVPRKNKRGQFGSGYWMVIMNDSRDIQGLGELPGEDPTEISIACKTFFKEIQDTRAEVR